MNAIFGLNNLHKYFGHGKIQISGKPLEAHENENPMHMKAKAR